MKIDIATDYGYTGWFILRCITEVIKRGTTDHDKAKDEQLRKKDEDGCCDVVLTLNGVELPFVETMHSVEGWFDEAVKKKANELIENKLQGKIEEIERITARTADQLRDIYNNIAGEPYVDEEDT